MKKSTSLSGYKYFNDAAKDASVAEKMLMINIDANNSKRGTPHQITSDTPNFNIVWSDLSYEIKSRKVTFGFTEATPIGVCVKTETKVILQPQTGSLTSGTLTALMGPSGAGKTTLLNCLSGSNNNWTGSIDLLTNGHEDEASLLTTKAKEKRKIKLNLAFVPQKDFLFEMLTVKETLAFSLKSKKLSTFKTPSRDANNFGDAKNVEDANIDATSTGDASDEEIITNIASELNLMSCLNVKVSNLSGGQCKRLSVGVELVSPPDVLILDEPTSGLDSMNALMTIQVIRNLLSRGTKLMQGGATYKPAIICSIHQPSFECLNLFDSIYLLNENGENIFFDSPKNISSFLHSKNIFIDNHHNPADYLLKLCSANYVDGGLLNIGIDTSKSIKNISQNGENISRKVAPTKNIETIEEPLTTNQVNYKFKVSIKEATANARRQLNSSSLIAFIFLLYQRNFKLMISDPAPLISRLVFCFVGLINLLVYKHKLGSHDGCWSSILNGANTGNGNNVQSIAKNGENIFSSKNISNKTLIDLMYDLKNEVLSSSYVKNMEYVHDNINVIVVSDILLIYFHVLITGSIIPIESKIVQKKIYNNWYTINSYIISRLTYFIPIMVIQVICYTLIFSVTSFQLIELHRFLTLCLAQLFIAWTSEVIGIGFGALFPGNLVSGITWTIMYTFPIVTMGGFFVRVHAVNPMVEWFMWFSQLRHAFEASLISTYGLGRCSNNNNNNNNPSDAITIHELMSPSKLLERTINNYNINFNDAKLISPIIGIKHTECMEEVINATRDYLGINNDYDYDYADVDGSSVDEGISSVSAATYASYSYPLSSFGISDDDLIRCYVSLFCILSFYILFAIISIRRLIKR